MLYIILVFSVLVAMLVAIAGTLMVTDKTRTLRPFDREATIPLRGLLALIIITSHMVSSFSSIALPAVAMFFFLSGYGLGISFKKKHEDYLKGFFSRRCSKLLPAFVTLTFISALMALLIDGQPLSEQLMRMTDGITILPYSWFIFAILYIYVAFYISALLGKTLSRTGYLLMFFILIYMYFTRNVGNWGHYWYTTIPAVILGYYMAIYEDRIERLVMRHTLTVYLSAVAVVLFSFYGKTKLILLISSPFEIWLGFWGLSVSVAGYLIIRALGTIKWKPLVWLGVISMEIYLVHGLLLLYIGKVLDSFSPVSDEMSYIVYIMLGYILSVLAAWIIHKITDWRRLPLLSPGLEKTPGKYT